MRIDAIRQRLDAATPEPWYRGRRYRHHEADENHDTCGACGSGEPVWAGRTVVYVGPMSAPITGRRRGYVHFHEVSPDELDHDDLEIYAGDPPDVRMVVGQWDYEEGGVLRDADAELIAHALADIAYLLDRVESAEKVTSAVLEALVSCVELPADLVATVNTHLEAQSRSD